MGLWDEIKDFGNRALCFTGLHSGSWEYETSGSCKQIFKCKRYHCDHVDSRTSHAAWTSWNYFKEKSCEQERHCTRCNAREEQLKHQSWTDWKYVFRDECDQERNCTRCDTTDYQTKHNYGSERFYSKTNDCSVYQKCHRCKDEKPLKDKEHKWVTIKHPSIPNQYRKYCERCGIIEEIENT